MTYPLFPLTPSIVLWAAGGCSNEVPTVTSCSQPIYGAARGKSTEHHRTQTKNVDHVCRWHLSDLATWQCTAPPPKPSKPFIQFTIKEDKEYIPFLDVLVRRKGNKFQTQTSVYRKPTHTDRYIPFSSHQPPWILRGDIQCLRGRALNVCDGK